MYGYLKKLFLSKVKLTFILVLSVYGIENSIADDIANRTALDLGVQWVELQQNQDGSWGNDENTRYALTSSIVDALYLSNRFSDNYYTGISWLENHSANNVDSLSRKIYSLVDHGNNIAADVSSLYTSQKPVNLGWGLSVNYESSPLDTALVLNAMLKMADSTGITAASNYLVSTQNADGGWSLTNTTVGDKVITAIVHNALASIDAPTAAVATALSSSSTFLTSVAMTDNSLVLSNTISALMRTEGLTAFVDLLITELLSRQSPTGEWNDVYTTSSVSRALILALGLNTNPNSNTRVEVVDQSLLAIINAQLGKNAYDNVVQNEMLMITTLDLRSSDVLTLAGLEYATNLQTIYVNSDTDLSAISGLTGVVIIVDSDSDDIIEDDDNCPLISNPDQLDSDSDGFGDVCDIDNDNDTVPNSIDNCPLISNLDQLDTDGDGAGDVCDSDKDNDTVLNAVDNCPLISNINQLDFDVDGQGDVCDNDDDNDGLSDIFEIANGLNPFDATGVNGANGDADGDGFTNLEEQVLGTDASAATGADSSPGLFNFSSATYSANEDAGTLSVPVTRSGSVGAVSVFCFTTDIAGQATAGTDYIAIATTLEWADGDASAKNCDITITNDIDIEGDETFQLDLSNPSGGAKLGNETVVLP